MMIIIIKIIIIIINPLYTECCTVDNIDILQ